MPAVQQVFYSVLFGFPLLMRGQSSCGTAVTIEPDTTITGYLSDSVYWYKFNADTSDYFISIGTPGQSPKAIISDLYLYSGSCINKTLIGHSSLYDSLIINATSLNVGNDYYIKIK